jgi:hypothetical protein
MYNAHPNIQQLAAELGSTDRGQRMSLKACMLLVVILGLMKNFLDLNSLVLNKY